MPTHYQTCMSDPINIHQMAVEIGLHCSQSNWQISDTDSTRRSRIFWTVYAIDITLAYNLGRPPSIHPDHISVKLPPASGRDSYGVLHITHRQLQNKIINSVYNTTKSKHCSLAEKSQIIRNLQAELDDWKSCLDDLVRINEHPCYPYR